MVELAPIPIKPEIDVPPRQVEQFCALLLDALRHDDPEGGLALKIGDELGRILGDGVRQLGDQLRDELETLDATVAQLQSLSKTRLLPGVDRSRDFLADLTGMQASARRMAAAFACLSPPANPVASEERNGEFRLPTSGLHLDARQDTEWIDDPVATASEPLALYRQEEPPDPHLVQEQCEAGEHFRRLTDYVQAEAHFNEAIRLDPQCHVAFVQRGMVYLLAGANDFAVDDFNAALDMQPHDPVVCSWRGDAHARAGRLDPAVIDYRRALQLQPDFHKTRFNLGIALRRLQEWSEARAEFNQIIAVWPDHAPCYYNLGLINVECQSFPEAIADFRCALRLNHDYPEAREQLQRAVQHEREAQQKLRPQPIVESKAVPAASDPDTRIPVQCPGCSAMGLLDWHRLDKVVICQQCHRSFGIKPDGKSVEVVRAGNGRWVELQQTLDRQKVDRHRRWMRAAVVACCLFPVVAFSTWKLARPSKVQAANELPKDLKQRAELFGSAWLRNDVPLMRRLTAPTQERMLYPWYNKHLPPTGRSDSIRPSLSPQVKIDVSSQPDQTDGSKVVLHMSGLEGNAPSADLTLRWRLLGDAWFFEPGGK